jgi:hypothetical protein
MFRLCSNCVAMGEKYINILNNVTYQSNKRKSAKYKSPIYMEAVSLEIWCDAKTYTLMNFIHKHMLKMGIIFLIRYFSTVHLMNVIYIYIFLVI